MFGMGGAPEGVIAAAAVKILGGDMQGRRADERAGSGKMSRDGIQR